MANPIYGTGNANMLQLIAGRARGISDSHRAERMQAQQNFNNQFRQDSFDANQEQRSIGNDFNIMKLIQQQAQRKVSNEFSARKFAAGQEQRGFQNDLGERRLTALTGHRAAQSKISADRFAASQDRASRPLTRSDRIRDAKSANTARATQSEFANDPTSGNLSSLADALRIRAASVTGDRSKQQQFINQSIQKALGNRTAFESGPTARQFSTPAGESLLGPAVGGALDTASGYLSGLIPGANLALRKTNVEQGLDRFNSQFGDRFQKLLAAEKAGLLSEADKRDLINLRSQIDRIREKGEAGYLDSIPGGRSIQSLSQGIGRLF